MSRKMLLHYFGEEYQEENCHNCDNCLHPTTKIEAKDELVVILRAVAAVKENFRQEYIIDFVKGRATDDIVSHKHNELEAFGAGEDMDSKMWNPVIRQALIAGYLKRCRELWLAETDCSRQAFYQEPRVIHDSGRQGVQG